MSILLTSRDCEWLRISGCVKWPLEYFAFMPPAFLFRLYCFQLVSPHPSWSIHWDFWLFDWRFELYRCQKDVCWSLNFRYPLFYLCHQVFCTLFQSFPSVFSSLRPSQHRICSSIRSHLAFCCRHSLYCECSNEPCFDFRTQTSQSGDASSLKSPASSDRLVAAFLDWFEPIFWITSSPKALQNDPYKHLFCPVSLA